MREWEPQPGLGRIAGHVVALIILVYPLLSLGRNIGFILVERKIVTRCANSFSRDRLLQRTERFLARAPAIRK